MNKSRNNKETNSSLGVPLFQIVVDNDDNMEEQTHVHDANNSKEEIQKQEQVHDANNSKREIQLEKHKKKKKSAKLTYKKNSRNYTKEQLKNGLEACRVRRVSICEAVKKYGVPRPMLCNQLSRSPDEVIYPHGYLGKQYETHIAEWIMSEMKHGYCVKKSDILNSVQAIVQTNNLKTPFTNGRPGTYWIANFLKRNPTVTSKIAERVDRVSEKLIRSWFDTIKTRLEENGQMDIYKNPTRIFSCDETNIKFCPSTREVLCTQRWRNVYEMAPEDEDGTITFFRTFSAVGEIVGHLLIFPCLQIPADIINSLPDGWKAGATENGWMKSETFLEFLSNSFIPMIQKRRIELPVILFVDGHKTHLSIEISEKCKEAGILLYKLPNSRDMLQPAHVGCFESLKSHWNSLLINYEINNKTSITPKLIAPLLNEALSKISKASIQKSFRISGLYPLNPNAVNYSKLRPPNKANLSQKDLDTSLLVIETLLGNKVNELKQRKIAPEYIELHNLWLAIKRKITT